MCLVGLCHILLMCGAVPCVFGLADCVLLRIFLSCTCLYDGPALLLCHNRYREMPA